MKKFDSQLIMTFWPEKFAVPVTFLICLKLYQWVILTKIIYDSTKYFKLFFIELILKTIEQMIIFNCLTNDKPGSQYPA